MFKTALQGYDAGPFVYRFQNTTYYYGNVVGGFIFVLFIPAGLLAYPWLAIMAATVGGCVYFGTIALDAGWRRVRQFVSIWALMIGSLCVLVGLPLWVVTANGGGVMFTFWHLFALGVGLLAFAYVSFPKKAQTKPSPTTATDRLKRFRLLEQKLTRSEMDQLQELPLTEQMHIIQQPMETVRNVLKAAKS